MSIKGRGGGGMGGGGGKELPVKSSRTKSVTIVGIWYSPFTDSLVFLQCKLDNMNLMLRVSMYL